jgi:hypothetical protein
VDWLDTARSLAQATPVVPTPPPGLPDPDLTMAEVLQRAISVSAVLAPVVLGLTQAWKMIGLSGRFVPLGAILTGMVISLGWEATTATHPGADWFIAAMIGIVSGLSSVGLFNVIKSVVSPEAFEPGPPRRRQDHEEADFREMRKG